MILPVGYVTILEAAETLLPAMYAGVPDLPIVTSLRQEGIDVRDGPAMDRAVVELWKAVDEGSLRPMAIGKRPGESSGSTPRSQNRSLRCAIPAVEDSLSCGNQTQPTTSWRRALVQIFPEPRWHSGKQRFTSSRVN